MEDIMIFEVRELEGEIVLIADCGIFPIGSAILPIVDSDMQVHSHKGSISLYLAELKATFPKDFVRRANALLDHKVVSLEAFYVVKPLWSSTRRWFMDLGTILK